MQVSQRKEANWLSELNYGVGIGSSTVVSKYYSELKSELGEDLLAKTILSQSTKFPHAAYFIPRFLQINKINSRETGLNYQDKVCLTLFIENIIYGVKRESSEHFKKTDFLCSLTRPSRSLQYNSEDQSACIILKTHKNNILNAKGGSKKVTAAAHVPNDTSLDPVIVAQGVNKDSIDHDDLIDEFNVHKKFSGNRGIWPILGCATYKKCSGAIKGDIDKTSLITPMAVPVSEVEGGEVELSIDEIIDLAYEVAHGVDCLHREKRIHGDLNGRNVLFSFPSSRDIIAGLIDFGFSFKIGEKGRLPFPLDEGYYGSITPTAPELFGNKNFTGDIFKTEIWAFGCLLYTLVFEQDFPWFDLLYDQYDDLEGEVSEQTMQEMMDLVQEAIEEPREELLLKENRDRFEEIDLLVYDMMRADPDLRPDSKEIVERIANLRKETVLEVEID